MSEFFSVSLTIPVIDDGQTSRSSTWSSEQILEEILSHTQGSSLKGGAELKYREINDTINLKPIEEITKNYDLGDDTMILTTLYLDIPDGSTFRFRVFDKAENGFLLYDSGKVTHYTDSVFVPYEDKDSNTNSLHAVITNYNPNNPVTLNMKLLGLTIQKNG
ncbi:MULTISPECIES: hypothetical protein [Clostridium]|uniref:hypothetical protein n=1 Tax=Clostridium TaxID=1485 RepID=UPI0008270F86|nr:MULTISPECIES: hypothetical protein [Clostridium]PJI07025.1 hypothetical protein CUB90_03730 [Clostridium sp. CT7]